MDVHIAWASETGRAVDLSKEFAALVQAKNIAISSVCPLSQATSFTKGIWIIFVSTTGQGQPPYSMRPFWKKIMKKGYKIEEQVLFAIYSLGDRGYGQNFGMTARKMRQRLKMLGAQQLVEIGLGDEQQALGVRQVFSSGWAQQLINSMNDLSKHGQSKIEGFKFDLREAKDEVKIEVVSLKEIGVRKGRKVMWMELEVDGRKIEEGDVVQIFPHNRKQDVEFMLNHFGKTGDEKYMYLGRVNTLMEILTEYANVSSTLNHYFFCNNQVQNLIACCDNELHRQKIIQFGKDFDEYHNYIGQFKRNIVQFIKDFQVKVDIEYFLSHINQLIGRKYSIASVAQQGKRCFILVKLAEIQITEGRLFKGLCSHDLVGEKVVRTGKIVRGDITPNDLRQRNVIVTLGTGIAPFIWMLDRHCSEQKRFLLMYCNSYKDELFHKSLLNQKTEKQDFFEECISCTREGGPKLVDLIYEKSQMIKETIDAVGIKNSRVFFCGPKQLQSFLAQTIAKILEMTVQQVQKSKLIVYQNW